MGTGMQCVASLFFVVCMGMVLSGCGGGGDSPPPQSTVPPPDGAINDPLFANQWHLENTGQKNLNGGQAAGTPGEDVNVKPVWSRGLLGQDIRIHVVDDGLEEGHEDLAPNVLRGEGYNFLHAQNGCTAPCTPNGLGRRDPSPTVSSDNNHGTSVAGVAAASANNVGGRGAAPAAKLVGYNLLAIRPSNDERRATAMSHNVELTDINTNSWQHGYEGNLIGHGFLGASESGWRTAVETGVTRGRRGRGTIYLFAAGNGDNPPPPLFGSPLASDNSNYSGWSNNRHVMAICAVDARGKKPSYSEPGANLWVCAPSDAGESVDLPAITTTDRTGEQGSNPFQVPFDYTNRNYTLNFSGTSSATPLAAGVTALVLQANPNLGWRDVRLILAETARKNDPDDPGWDDIGVNTTGGKYHHNHKYGFGVVNADAAVQRAITWTNVGTQIIKSFPSVELRQVNVAIPDANTAGVADTIAVSGSGISSIEFIEITFTADHPFDGELNVTLVHEDTGIQSQLATERRCRDISGKEVPCGGYQGWVFGSARHLGEAADGTWTLRVSDRIANDAGTFHSWKLTFYGR